jgi:hypothetical protein
MKNCFKCGEDKPLTEYYKHKQMGDGHLNKCKSCTKNDSTNHRNDNIEKIRKYDRNRGNRQSKEYYDEYKAKYPNEHKAHKLVRKAIFNKWIIKKPCEVCGSEDNVHAHHDNYLEPLSVRWLCCAHHKQWHRDNGEGLNR